MANDDSDDSGSLLSSALEGSPTASLILDADKRVRYANEEAVAFARRGADELLGERFGHAVGCLKAKRGCDEGPECEGCVLPGIIEAALTNGTKAQLVVLHPPYARSEVLGGAPIAVSVARCEVDTQPHVILNVQAVRYVQGATRDESLDLETVTNALAEALFTVRLPERTIEYVNHAAEELFGLRARELIGQPTTLLYASEDDAAAFGAKLAHALAQGQPQLRTEHEFARGGARFWASVSTTFLFEGERPTRVISVLSDISTRKNIERDLRASEQRYRAIFDSAPLGIALFEIDTGERRAVNDRYCEFIGIDRKHAYTQPIFSTVGAQSITAAEAALARLRQGVPGVAEIELDRVRADGETVHLRELLMPLGDQSFALAVIEDVTERRRLEREKARIADSLRERQKLDSLGLLAGGIAHDFNNILAGISINAEILRARIDEPSVARILDAIDNSTIRAAELTRQLLGYAGKGRIVTERIDLGELVSSSTELLRLSVSRKTELEHSLAPTSVVEADPTQLQQVLLNLVINASQALPEAGGRVRIATRDVACSGKIGCRVYPDRTLAPGTYAMLEVRDDGQGIPKPLLSKIFDPFFTTKPQGHGLGLSAILGIANAHGGGVQVHSEPGEGTVFRVLLPTVEGAAARRTVDRTGVDTWHGSGRVLLVDDDDELRTAVREMLELLGLEVTEASDGAEAIAHFESPRGAPFVCVILDLTMPVMDGHETLVRLREFDERIPVLLASGHSEYELSERYGEVGFAGFLHKPYSRQDLVSLLSALE